MWTLWRRRWLPTPGSESGGFGSGSHSLTHASHVRSDLMDEPMLFENGASPDDAIQGNLGNCWCVVFRVPFSRVRTLVI